MRKIIPLFCLLLVPFSAHSYSMDSTASYVYSSDSNQARAGLSLPLGLNVAVGLEGKYVEDKTDVQDGGLKNPVYSLYVPLMLNLDTASIVLTPFYYFKNKSGTPLFRDAYAYGLTARLNLNLLKDDVEERYTQAYLEAAYARQRGAVLLDQTNAWKNQYYDQTAFTVGLRQNFYNAFTFQISGTAYQYPDGISQVKSFRGIVDQKDLGFTQSYDVNRTLGKYILAARVARLWAENHSSLYMAYHYGEFYTADPQHSILVGNTFRVANSVYIDMAYNHLQTTNSQHKNKRDLFFISLNYSF